MSQWSDEIQKAEQLAKDHPQQADEALQKGEQFAEERTDHRFDQQIGAAGDKVEQRYGGGQQDQQGQQAQDPQNQGQDPQNQGQQ
jgi:hypothetical protein